jgi:hypothetical protein
MEKWLLFEKTMWWTQQINPRTTSNLHHDVIAMTYQWSQMMSLDVAMTWHHTGMRLSGSWRHVRQTLRFRYSDIAEWLPWIGKCLRGENYRHHWSGFGGDTENHKNPVGVLIYRFCIVCCTLPLQWFLAPARLPVSTTATMAQIPAVSSKAGAVIGAVLPDGIFRMLSHHWHQTHMNNCRINEIANKLKH